MKNFNQQQGEMSNAEFYQDVSKHGNANFDGNQKNGRHGSPIINSSPGNDANVDYGGVGYDNQQTKFGNIIIQIDDDMQWEKKNGTFVNPNGTFKDVDTNKAYEFNLRPIVEVPGMPSPNHNFNTHCDEY